VPALHKQRRHGFLAFITHRLWPLAAQAGLPVLPKNASRITPQPWIIFLYTNNHLTNNCSFV